MSLENIVIKVNFRVVSDDLTQFEWSCEIFMCIKHSTKIPSYCNKNTRNQ